MDSKKMLKLSVFVMVIMLMVASFCTVSVMAEDSFPLGDVDLNGVLNVRDATAVQKYLAGIIDFTSDRKKLADTDGDGKVSIKDATKIQKRLAGIEDDFIPPVTDSDELPILPYVGFAG